VGAISCKGSKYSYIHTHNGLLFIDDFVEHIPYLVLLKDKLTYTFVYLVIRNRKLVVFY